MRKIPILKQKATVARRFFILESVVSATTARFSRVGHQTVLTGVITIISRLRRSRVPRIARGRNVHSRVRAIVSHVSPKITASITANTLHDNPSIVTATARTTIEIRTAKINVCITNIAHSILILRLYLRKPSYFTICALLFSWCFFILNML